MVEKSALLRGSCSLLGVPAIVTEQNPTKLGGTVAELRRPDDRVFSKKLFSMLTSEVLEELRNGDGMKGRDQMLLVGIEAHVCVLQTVLDAKQHRPDMEVFLACDAVSSQRELDRSVALQRMQGLGVTLCTAESAVFEMMASADHPNFREVSDLVKKSRLHEW